MADVWLLALVSRYPNRTALARRARDGSVFAALRRLESDGLLIARPSGYRVTRRGRAELALSFSLARLLLTSLR